MVRIHLDPPILAKYIASEACPALRDGDISWGPLVRIQARPQNLTNLANWSNLNLNNPEEFASLMICLIYKQTYLLDQLLRAQEAKFIKEGGFRENLFAKRRAYRIKQRM